MKRYVLLSIVLLALTPLFSYAAIIVDRQPDGISGSAIRYSDAGSSLNGWSTDDWQSSDIGQVYYWVYDPLQTNGGVIPFSTQVKGYAAADCSGSALWTESTTTDVTVPSATTTLPVLFADFSILNRSISGAGCVTVGTVPLFVSNNLLHYLLTQNVGEYSGIFTDSEGIASTTRIIAFVPENGSTIATSSTAGFEIYGFVNEDDWSPGTHVVMKYAPNTAYQASVTNPNLLFTTLDFNISQPGFFGFVTTSPVLHGGEYTMQMYIETPSFFTKILSWLGLSDLATWDRNAQRTSSFTAGQKTSYDIFVQETESNLQNYLNSSTASTTCYVASFDFWGCVNLLFVPQPQPIEETLLDFRDGFLSRYPWGYVTRFMVIVSGTAATSSLPTADVHIPVGPSDQFIYHIDMGEMVHGAGTFLDSVTDRNTGLTMEEEVRPYWKWFLAVIVMTIIIFDIIALRRHK